MSSLFITLLHFVMGVSCGAVEFFDCADQLKGADGRVSIHANVEFFDFVVNLSTRVDLGLTPRLALVSPTRREAAPAIATPIIEMTNERKMLARLRATTPSSWLPAKRKDTRGPRR